MATMQILGIYLHENIPLEPSVVKKYDGEIDCARGELIEGVTDHLWKRSKDHEFLKVFLKNGQTETLYYKDLISGALLKSIVDRAKDYAIKRAIADPSKDQGVSLDDLIKAADAEYKENEIFPKSDSQEDWLQLLDFSPDNVASVKPVGRNKGEEVGRKNVI